MERHNRKPASLTVAISAYNEEAHIRHSYETVKLALADAGIGDYEIFIITNTAKDGTHDRTPEIANEIAKTDSRVIPLHYARYMNLGFKYHQGVLRAKKEYYLMIPGDNDTTEETMREILRHCGDAPSIITYTANPEARPLYIRIVSRGFTVLCNCFFGLRMKYYNGISIHAVDRLRRVPMSTDCPAFSAEIIVYLAKSGADYMELPQIIRKSGAGKTFRIRSVFESLAALAVLFWNIHVRGWGYPQDCKDTLA